MGKQMPAGYLAVQATIAGQDEPYESFRDEWWQVRDMITDLARIGASRIVIEWRPKVGIGAAPPPPLPDLPGVLLGDAVTLAFYADEGESFGTVEEG